MHLAFKQGGIVPGPLGAAVPAIVHGGEEVLTPEQRRQRGGMEVNITFAEPVYVRDEADIDKLTGRISRRLRAELGGRGRALGVES